MVGVDRRAGARLILWAITHAVLIGLAARVDDAHLTLGTSVRLLPNDQRLLPLHRKPNGRKSSDEGLAHDFGNLLHEDALPAREFRQPLLLIFEPQILSRLVASHFASPGLPFQRLVLLFLFVPLELLAQERQLPTHLLFVDLRVVYEKLALSRLHVLLLVVDVLEPHGPVDVEAKAIGVHFAYRHDRPSWHLAGFAAHGWRQASQVPL
mmetsp:Transcript_32686/g.61416  ORF Transcript_32686/g.61416 Transcript_32686/m.61416 type:complete len:209 (+) Transcript_32686:387-1013(+)